MSTYRLADVLRALDILGLGLGSRASFTTAGGGDWFVLAAGWAESPLDVSVVEPWLLLLADGPAPAVDMRGVFGQFQVQLEPTFKCKNNNSRPVNIPLNLHQKCIHHVKQRDAIVKCITNCYHEQH